MTKIEFETTAVVHKIKHTELVTLFFLSISRIGGQYQMKCESVILGGKIKTIRRNRPDTNRIDYAERVDEYEIASWWPMMTVIEVNVHHTP